MRRSTLVRYFPKSVREHNFVLKPYRILALGQIVAPLVVNMCMKFQNIFLKSKEVMVEVFHDFYDNFLAPTTPDG